MNLLAAMRYLVALDQHRHFGRAAQACHITQPALSNALRALETEYGVPIVKRSRVYAGLTEEGQAVLATAQRLLRETDNLEQELKSTAENPRGALRLAAVPTAVPLLSVFAALLHRRHPGVTPVVLAMSSPDIEKRLEDLSLDLALGYIERPLSHGRFRTWPLTRERYFLLRRAEGPPAPALRIGAPLRWVDAAALPLCQLTTDMHNRAIVDRALNPDGPPPAPAIETNALLTLALSVATGNVCAILPGAMIAAVRSQGELEALPLVDPDIRTPVGFIALSGAKPSRALQAALQLLGDSEWLSHMAQLDGASFKT
ncbi:MAG: LysR family transcriptional regulator [Steroidobacteraceae bacterium]